MDKQEHKEKKKHWKKCFDNTQGKSICKISSVFITKML